MMKTLLIFSVFFSAVSAVSVRAESQVAQKVESVRKWFSNWAMGLKRSAVESRYRKVRTSAVAAVRGAKQDSNPNLPYWKGTWSDKKAAERTAERAELEAAVELVLAGDAAGAEAALDRFEKERPKSTLLPDVKAARVQLAVLKAVAPPAPSKPEKQVETEAAETLEKPASPESN